jgi:phosphoglycolate phosphatase/pyrophosphatase PpaX/AHBA synthesis associated protein
MPPTDAGRPVAVVFDLDGVLMDTTENMRYAFTAAWRAAGRRGQPPFADFLTRMGAPLAEILGAFDLPAWTSTVYAEESTARIDLVHTFPGIVDILRSLRSAAVPIAVATGKSQQRAVQALDVGGLSGHVDVVVGSDRVRRPKPDPESLHTALSELGEAGYPVVTAEEAVFVGDSVLDMRCGRAAGAHVVAAGWGQTDAGTLLAERPDAFAAAPRDLMALLGPASSAAFAGAPAMRRAHR